MIMRCSFSKQTNNHGLYTAAQGELRERGERTWDGTVRHGNVVIFFCIRDQRTARTAWSRNNAAIGEPPNEHVRVFS